MQTEVINGSDPGDAAARVAGADAVHERAALAAEVVRHLVAGGDGLARGVLLQLVLAAGVLHLAVLDDEVGGEHGGGDLATVGAVADEGVDEAGLLGWLFLVSVFEQ